MAVKPGAVEAEHMVPVGVLAHHFDNIEQQRGAARLGMWMFLVTEVLFFGGVFVAYAAYRIWYPHDFEAGSSKLNVLIASINSLILLTSSLTCTLAIHAAQTGNRKQMVRMLAVSAALGLAFLGFKAVEYTQDYHENLIPGPSFNSSEFEHEGANPQRVQLFFLFYYFMTGLHVIHLAVGVGLLIWLTVLAQKGWIPPERYVVVEVTGLYWHFVDLMWMFLLPLLYLAGSHHSLHF
jgi:cytochrome c oxidase subunit III